MHQIVNSKARIILGVDPGFVCAGFGVIRLLERRAELLESGVLAQASKDSIPLRLERFHDFMAEKIVTYAVTDLALETPFLGKNAQNFLKLGYLRGALFLLAQKQGLIIHEFSPREIKQLITGSGCAEKEQLARVLMRLFPSLVMPRKLDATDAVAVALCGLWAIQRRPSQHV